MKRLIPLLLTFSAAAFAQFTATYDGIPGQAMTITAGVLPSAYGGTGVANSVNLTLGTTAVNLATIGTGIVKVTTTTGALTDAASSDVISLFSGTCNSGTFLNGAGACASPSGSGTVNSGAQYDLAYYATAGTAVSQLATGNNGVLVTGGTGIPSIASTLPSAVQGNITSLGTIGSGTWQGSVIAQAYLPVTPTCASNVVAFSATPVFNLALGCPELTLTGNVTSFTVTNAAAGMVFVTHICQNATGGYLVSGAPAILHNFMTIGTTASKCSDEWYRVDTSGSAAFPIGALINN